MLLIQLRHQSRLLRRGQVEQALLGQRIVLVRVSLLNVGLLLEELLL